MSGIPYFEYMANYSRGESSKSPTAKSMGMNKLSEREEKEIDIIDKFDLESIKNITDSIAEVTDYFDKYDEDFESDPNNNDNNNDSVKEDSELSLIKHIKEGGTEIITEELKKVQRKINSRESTRYYESEGKVGYNFDDTDQGRKAHKLEIELQNEAVSRKKLLIYLRNTEKLSQEMKKKIEQLNETITDKDKTIENLHAEVRSLNIQLELMDTKYFEVKKKLKTIKKRREKIKNKKNKNLLDSFGLPNNEPDVNDYPAVLPTIKRTPLTVSSSSSNGKQLSDSSRSGPRSQARKSLKKITMEQVEYKLIKNQGLKPEWTEERILQLLST
jgi:hypothetical protein